jgi:hypothetical protein
VQGRFETATIVESHRERPCGPEKYFRSRLRAARAGEHARCAQELTAHHYLPVAEVARDRGRQIAECEGRWVAVILWCAAAKRLKAREQWIGWDPRTRAERLKLVVQQARFCLLHRQPNLASRVLAESVRQLPEVVSEEFSKKADHGRRFGEQPTTTRTKENP